MISFELDARQIAALTAELDLTERQAKAAMSRAVRRTAGTLRRRAEKELKSELDVKKVAYLRRRLKELKLTRTGFQGIRLWFGENAMPVSALRGKVSKTGTGASFSGKAGSADFPGGFVTKGKYGRTVFMRRGRERLPIVEGEISVKPQMDAIVVGDLFADTLALLWKNFERDMRARAQHGVGMGRRA